MTFRLPQGRPDRPAEAALDPCRARIICGLLKAREAGRDAGGPRRVPFPGSKPSPGGLPSGRRPAGVVCERPVGSPGPRWTSSFGALRAGASLPFAPRWRQSCWPPPPAVRGERLIPGCQTSLQRRKLADGEEFLIPSCQACLQAVKLDSGPASLPAPKNS